MAKRYYRPELDALRFFAFACVFCHHLLIIKGRWFQPISEAGAFGMGMFFMLSAYLIITILLREQESTGTVSLSAFAARRVLRIWPLYFLVLFGAYLLGHHLKSIHVPGHALLAFSFLLGNVYILHHGWIGPIDPLWSLSVEEQFYLAIPAIVRLGGKRAILVVGVVTLSVAYAVLAWLGHRAAPSGAVWVNSFVQFQFFAVGGLTALWLHDRHVTLSLKWRGVLVVTGLALWLQAGKLYPLHTLRHTALTPLIVAYLLMLLGTFLIFLSVIDIEIRIPHTVIYLGKISYGLYLFHAFILWMLFDTVGHWPRMIFFQHHKGFSIPLAFGLTVATAAFSYHFFERPILKYKERFERIRTRPA